MNTFWTDRTVNRNADKAGIRPVEWVDMQRKQYEKMTGVKWSWYTAHGGYQIDPVDDGIPVSEVGMDIVAEVMDAYIATEKDAFGYVSYMQVTHKSGLRLDDIMRAVKWMEKQGEARRTVNRMGKGYAFKIVGEK